MYIINNDLSVYCTRGDFCQIPVQASIGGEPYQFKAGDVVRFKAFKKKDCSTVVIQRDYVVDSETDVFTISLDAEATKIGDVISKPVDYWYEVELNPETNPQTIVGYDESGAKVFKLFPEGKDVDNEDIEVVGTKTLQELVDYALSQAKESGEFDGTDGYTPIKGVDYFDGKSIYFIDDYPVVTPTGNFSVETLAIPNAQVGDLILWVDGNIGVITQIDIKANIRGSVVCNLKGKDGTNGHTPVRGTDYWTDADRQEMVNEVLNELPDEAGGNTLIVYREDAHFASHTPDEISTHIANGGTAVFYDGEDYYNLSVSRPNYASFLSVEDDNFSLKLFLINTDGTWDRFVFNPASKSAIGDISTALDSIIALQEELIGS